MHSSCKNLRSHQIVEIKQFAKKHSTTIIIQCQTKCESCVEFLCKHCLSLKVFQCHTYIASVVLSDATDFTIKIRRFEIQWNFDENETENICFFHIDRQHDRVNFIFVWQTNRARVGKLLVFEQLNRFFIKINRIHSKMVRTKHQKSSILA